MNTLEQTAPEVETPNPLTPRQIVVLTYLADGHTAEHIAGFLCITSQAVNKHISAARDALDAQTTTEAVVTALRRGLLGGTPLAAFPKPRRRRRTSPARAGLSDREVAALALLADGLTAAEAGDRLGVPEHTVKDVVRAARTKLGCRNTAHMIAVCVRRGLLPEDTNHA